MNSLPITKAHGTGNDFVLVEDLDGHLEIDADLVRQLCDRNFGVGADGLIRLAPADEDAAAFFMDYRNSDGSIAEMCGNGIRCSTKYLIDRGLLTSSHDRARRRVGVQTRSGVRQVTYELGGDDLVSTVEVDMGPPSFEPASVPLAPDFAESLQVPFESIHAGERLRLNAVSMGNPHAVVFGPDPVGIDVASVGREIEKSAIFPEGANVEFVEVVSSSHLKMRVWERGVGETLACGSGACAAFAAARELEMVGDSVTLSLPGGELRLRWDGTIMMAGPAVEVFDAVVNLDTLGAPTYHR